MAPVMATWHHAMSAHGVRHCHLNEAFHQNGTNLFVPEGKIYLLYLRTDNLQHLADTAQVFCTAVARRSNKGTTYIL